MTHILTLHLDPAAQAHFDHLRRQHYPPALNHIPAHITLFHTLPDTPGISSKLSQTAAAEPAFSISVTGLRSLGKGVAYTLRSPDLTRLHTHLAQTFRDYLTPQDLQPFRPHIVVQNKATPDLARTLLADLERTFHAMEFTALGLDLWQYLGGPWRHIETHLFPRSPLETR